MALYLENKASPEIRPTDDVDCIIELSSYSSYSDIEARARALGLEHDTSAGAPICRWICQGIKTDIMPTEGSILGFRNRWYPSGIVHRVSYRLPDGQDIFLLSAPFFIATKIDAFTDRGAGDFRFSSDVEDIIAIVDGRDSLTQELKNAPSDVSGYIAEHFQTWIKNPEFRESIEGYLPASREGMGRQRRLLAVLQEVAAGRGGR